MTTGRSRKKKAAPRAHATTAKVKTERFPIVGVGASAGGLDAFKIFLAALPADTGMAFVLIQHLDPNHESLSASILSRSTRMPVNEVRNQTKVERNHVYLIPPNFDIEISRRVLHLVPRTETRGQHMAIDWFLRSLAGDQKNLAAGVVLSGSGSDGTEGLAAIKAEGGITFAQTPATARFEEMPQSAIASGSVDITLPPKEIAHELARIAQHQFIYSPKAAEPALDTKGQLDSRTSIFQLLRKIHHVDFSHYKTNTIQRRLERRMMLNRIDNLPAYSEFLSAHPDELKALHADILIHVTRFFRDTESFKAMSRDVFPRIVKDKPFGAPIRIWVPGCSTGEEVYSIAITLLEFLGDRASQTPIQIFATDISEQAIQKARVGEYLESIRIDVAPDRLKRYFSRTDSGTYKISKSIRDFCLFSRHDLTVDPPFARIDFISCRNLLIYFSAPLQKHVIPIFHYSLVAKGVLCLGKSETIGGLSHLFTLIDKTNKLYARKNAPISLNLQFPASTYVHGTPERPSKSAVFIKLPADLQKLSDLALQAEYPGVLINDDMEILQFHGRTAPFIEPMSGVATYHLLKMVRPDIIPYLRSLINTARNHDRPAKKENSNQR